MYTNQLRKGRYQIMTNTTVKVTKKDRFMEIIEIATELGREDLIDFCNHEIELLDRKASKSGESKSKKENEELMNILYDELVGIGKAVTITEFMKASSTVAERELSNQKITSLFTKMKGERVDKVVLKGKAYYSAI